MANTKISEYSSIPANNTEIDGINIAEGCAPSGINNAIRELMAQLKDFQTGSAGDNLTVGGNLSVTGAINLGQVLTVTQGGTGLSSVTAGDMLYASASNTLAKLAGVSDGNVLLSGTAPSWGKVPLTTHVTGTLPIANGGTGQTSATAAINALLPSQSGQSGKILQTNGTNVSWATVSAGSSGTVTSITAGAGLSGGTITTSGTISMGTPGTLSVSSSNSASGSTHTHEVTFPVSSVKGAASDTAATGNIILADLTSFQRSGTTNGYQRLPSGLIIQWGNQASGGTSTNVTFPTAFSSACYSVTLTSFLSGDVGGVDNSSILSSAPSTTGFTISNASSITSIYWMAIGV